MITVYKKNAIPKSMEYVSLNDVFFNKYTVDLLDKAAEPIIEEIDHSGITGKYTISSRFDHSQLNIDKLSTGCKTILNIMYNPDKVFDIRECGDNALDIIYALPQGNVFCAYPFISFRMTAVTACDKKGKRDIGSYEELKEWWTNED